MLFSLLGQHLVLLPRDGLQTGLVESAQWRLQQLVQPSVAASPQDLSTLPCSLSFEFFKGLALA